MNTGSRQETKVETEIIEINDLSSAEIKKNHKEDTPSKTTLNAKLYNETEILNPTTATFSSRKNLRTKTHEHFPPNMQFRARPEDQSPIDKFMTMLAKALEGMIDRVGYLFFNKSQKTKKLSDDINIDFMQPTAPKRKKRTNAEEELDDLSFSKRSNNS